ncbi:MAG: vitamin K epoxide reductase family protein [Zetaproteobacteria bacterium]|nr:MAG: vitamin K epoxide reductase family protein [Zetaproteobacteria bacterium]
MPQETPQGLRPLLWTSVILSSVGIVISGYLVVKRFTGGNLVCTRWADCDVVNNSVYSQLFGVPVSAIGLVGYLALLGLAIAALWTHGRARHQILLLTLFLSLGGVGFSAYLTYLEIYVIEALCSWCVASAVVIMLLAIVMAVASRRAA